jgi:uncharacterized phiE125 gp8 family phage protein
VYGLTTTVEPAEEPVDVPLARLHVRLDHAEEDGLIREWIAAARRYTETHCGRRWIEQTVELTLDEWPDLADYRFRADEIRIPVEPVSSVSSVTYYDEDGAQQTFSSSSYWTALKGSPPIVVPKDGVEWPDLHEGRPEAIAVTFKAGVANAMLVDPRVKEAILLTLTYWSENRGGEEGEAPTSRGLPAGAIRLLDSMWTGAY